MRKLLFVFIFVSSCGKPYKVENFGRRIKPSPIDSLVIQGYPIMLDEAKKSH